jgi:biopolymer transport protein TolQ
MNVVNDLSFFSLITGATIPVQLVMLILLAASGFSWWYIFIKVSVLKSAELAVDEFENTFWTSGILINFMTAFIVAALRIKA